MVAGRRRLDARGANRTCIPKWMVFSKNSAKYYDKVRLTKCNLSWPNKRAQTGPTDILRGFRPDGIVKATHMFLYDIFSWTRLWYDVLLCLDFSPGKRQLLIIFIVILSKRKIFCLIWFFDLCKAVGSMLKIPNFSYRYTLMHLLQCGNRQMKAVCPVSRTKFSLVAEIQSVRAPKITSRGLLLPHRICSRRNICITVFKLLLGA